MKSNIRMKPYVGYVDKIIRKTEDSVEYLRILRDFSFNADSFCYRRMSDVEKKACDEYERKLRKALVAAERVYQTLVESMCEMRDSILDKTDEDVAVAYFDETGKEISEEEYYRGLNAATKFPKPTEIKQRKFSQYTPDLPFTAQDEDGMSDEAF